MSLLFKISYGLYIVSASADGKKGGCMSNTLCQQTSTPERLSITLNKSNYTTELIEKSGKLAVSVLSEGTSFDMIKGFGMRSGRDVDKFAGIATQTTASGLLVPTDNVIGYFDLKVEDKIDLGTHMLFITSTNESVVFDAKGAPLTYGYYHANIKPKPAAPQPSQEEEVWVCKICGYVHKGKMTPDFTCPICKHPASDFERVSPK